MENTQFSTKNDQNRAISNERQSEQNLIAFERFKVAIKNYKALALKALDGIFLSAPRDKFERGLIKSELNNFFNELQKKLNGLRSSLNFGVDISVQDLSLQAQEEKKSDCLNQSQKTVLENESKIIYSIISNLSNVAENTWIKECNKGNSFHKKGQKKSNFKSLNSALSKIEEISIICSTQVEKLTKELKRKNNSLASLQNHLEDHLKVKIHSIGKKPKNKSTQSNYIPEHFSSPNIEKKTNQAKAGKDQRTINSIKPKIDQIRPSQDSPFIGGNITLIAVKNETSYLLATNKRGLVLIENDQIMFQDLLPQNCMSLLDLLYIPDHDFYLMCHNKQVYKKDIDHLQAYLYLPNVKCFGWPKQCIKYSRVNERIFINSGSKEIVIFNPRNVSMRFTISSILGNLNADFTLFEKSEKFLMFLTLDCRLGVQEVEYNEQKSSVIDMKKLPARDFLIKETGCSLAVDPACEFVCVSTRGTKSQKNFIMRYIVYGLKNNLIGRVKHIFNCWREEIPFQFVFRSLGQIESKIMFFGLSGVEASSDDIFFIGFDLEKQKIEVVTQARLFQDRPTRVLAMDKVGGKFYCCGQRGGVYELKVFDDNDK